MTSSPHYIEESCLSVAWGRALRLAIKHGGELVPLVVTFTEFEAGKPVETRSTRMALDSLLAERRTKSVSTVAGTLFPDSMWNPRRGATALYSRYSRIYPRLREIQANKNGTYFGRMTAAERRPANQLDTAIRSYKSKGNRRSKLQVSIFDPGTDHRDAPYLGFPCLQHVSFAPCGTDELRVNAFYTMQYLVQKAYGNYLGLAALGRFVAHELGRRLTRVTCVAGIAQVETKIRGKGLTRAELQPLLDTIHGTGETPKETST